VEFQYAPMSATPVFSQISVLPPDLVTPLGSSPYMAAWPAVGDTANPLHNGLADGQYLFRVILTDKAGNSSIVGPTAVTIDTTPPDAAILDSLAPEPGQTIYFSVDARPVFAASASDPGPAASGVVEVDFMYATKGATLPNLWSQFTLISSDTLPAYGAAYAADVPDGDYIFAVKAVDRAGNESLLTTNGADLPPAYKAGVTQEVVINAHGPTGGIAAPAAQGKLTELR